LHGGPEAADHLGGDAADGLPMEGRELGEIRDVTATGVPGAIGVGQLERVIFETEISPPAS
jgi:hypothetical protein